MIVGLGTDIVEIARIASSLSRLGDNFSRRILTPFERERMQSLAKPESYLAKRFAAKEAAVKALGTGIGRGISWQHFEVRNTEQGAPILVITDYAKQRCDELGVRSVHLSISDEQHYAVATVILES